jgi:hypothetical protein
MAAFRRAALIFGLAAPALAQVPPAPPAHAAQPAHAVAPADRLVSLPSGQLQAHVLGRSHSAVAVAPGGPSPTLVAGELLLVKSTSVAKRRPSAKTGGGAAADRTRRAVQWALPYEVHFRDEGGEVRSAGLVAEVGGGGLRPAPDGAEFGGEVFVALEDRTDPGRTYRLPVAIEVLVTAPVDRVEPGQVELAATNSWRSIRLSSAAAPDEFQVKLRSPTDPEGVELAVSTVRPRLRVEVSPQRIQGLGLELATVNVSAEDLAQPRGRKVTLSSTGGSLTPTEVQLDEQGMAQAQIRSVAVGTTQVVARSPSFSAGTSAAVSFTAPWPFILATLLGGAVGAVLRLFQPGQRASGRRRPLAVDVALGMAGGLVTAVLYAVGVNLLPVTPTATAGEALVFGLAAVGGYLGLLLPKRAG